MNGTSGSLSRGRQLLFSLDRKKELKVEFERVALPQLSHLAPGRAAEAEPAATAN